MEIRCCCDGINLLTIVFEWKKIGSTYICLKQIIWAPRYKFNFIIIVFINNIVFDMFHFFFCIFIAIIVIVITNIIIVINIRMLVDLLLDN